MFNFQNPFAFFLLLLIPILFILRRLKIFNRISFPAVLSDWNGQHFTWRGKSQKFLSILAKILLGIGFSLVVTAFADPAISSQEKVFSTLGTDIVFVLDTSPSMAAKDVDGNSRLEATLRSIYSLARAHDGCRLGIVALGSSAAVIVPPTIDSESFNSSLGRISVGSMGDGSAIGDGLSTAVCHLASSSAPKKCIILFTDGENNAGEIHPETAAKLAANNGITLYVVGIGSKGTVPIEYTDPATGKQYSGYLNSNFNPASLKKIAEIANGRYFEAQTLSELSERLNTVSKQEQVAQNYTYKTVNKLYYQKFLFIALILFSVSWFIKRILLKELICFRHKKILFARSGFLLFAYIMLILANMGLTWGTYLVPVQKSGTAVSMVFDISNSMMAKDCPMNTTRLKAAGTYAKKLLSNMSGVPVSVVLAKGDGIPAIPLTEDTAQIESLLDALSPNLMTVPGTRLGKGILKAKETFPSKYSAAGRIWVFTDGEETDGELVPSLSECLKSGIPVTIIGFGTEKGIEITTGDGKTKVNSALRSQEIENAISEATSKFNLYKNRSDLSYINSNEKGSAAKLLSQLRRSDSDNLITSYESKPVQRYKLFITLSLLSFILSYIVTEINFSKFIKKSLPAEFLALIVTLSGCGSDTVKIFDGTYSYHKKDYRHSISCFIDVSENALSMENQQTLDFALYDLGTVYAMIGENPAAIEQFAKISEEAPSNVRYAAFYNAGVLSYKAGNYEDAQKYFRKALETNSAKIEAKINFELSAKQAEEASKKNENESIQAQAHESNIPDLEKAVFKHIKENDQKQWKNSESQPSEISTEDY